VSNNFTSVQNLLQGTGGVATTLSSTLSQITDPTQGSITLDLQGMSTENQDLSTQISAMQTQLATQDQLLVAEYAQMQNTLDEMPMLQSQITQQLGSLG
jgi:flagellar capping protein FliD